jgi:tetratricopeptide (TPR) repeat protein
MRKAVLVLSVLLAAQPAWAAGPRLYFYADRQRIKAAEECELAADNNGIRACSFLILVGGVSSQASLYYLRAVAYINKGQLDHAIADLSRVISTNPNDDYFASLVYAERSIAYRKDGQADKANADKAQAVAHAAKVVEKFPGMAGYNNQAWVLHLVGEDEEALPDAMKAVQMDPQNCNFLETRAEIQEKLGNREDSIADYRATLRLALASEQSNSQKMYDRKTELEYLNVREAELDAEAGLARLGATP